MESWRPCHVRKELLYIRGPSETSKSTSCIKMYYSFQRRTNKRGKYIRRKSQTNRGPPAIPSYPLDFLSLSQSPLPVLVLPAVFLHAQQKFLFLSDRQLDGRKRDGKKKKKKKKGRSYREGQDGRSRQAGAARSLPSSRSRSSSSSSFCSFSLLLTTFFPLPFSPSLYLHFRGKKNVRGKRGD